MAVIECLHCGAAVSVRDPSKVRTGPDVSSDPPREWVMRHGCQEVHRCTEAAGVDAIVEPAHDLPNRRSASTQGKGLRFVMLENGEYHGQLALAPPPPGSLRFGFPKNGLKAGALYLYADGMTRPHPEHGELPIMMYMGENKFEPR